jgi:porphobilinogen synthase
VDSGFDINAGGLNQRRLRQNRWIRELVQQYRISSQQLIQPLFVVEDIRDREQVPGLTGTFRETPDSLLKTIESDLETGIRKFILFGVPAEKTQNRAFSGFTVSQIGAIKSRFGKDLFLFADVCLCSATTHGHCGILSPKGDAVENKSTVEELARLAFEYAQAGADCVAPSDMMDGRIAAIRNRLDRGGFEQTLLMSYAAKFHSKFYGPFRLAADSAPKPAGNIDLVHRQDCLQARPRTKPAGNIDDALSDRSTYQIDPANPNDALQSAHRDSAEGADILMVKPGLPYLDILSRLSSEIKKPWAVYEVSGEFAAIEVLSQQGLIRAPEAHLECWTSFLRSGASMIITYGARFARDYLGRL